MTCMNEYMNRLNERNVWMNEWDVWMNEWMKGWMREWMHERMKWRNEWMQWMNESIMKRMIDMNECMKWDDMTWNGIKWTRVELNEMKLYETIEWMRWMHEWMNRQMESNHHWPSPPQPPHPQGGHNDEREVSRSEFNLSVAAAAAAEASACRPSRLQRSLAAAALLDPCAPHEIMRGPRIDTITSRLRNTYVRADPISGERSDFAADVVGTSCCVLCFTPCTKCSAQFERQWRRVMTIIKQCAYEA